MKLSEKTMVILQFCAKLNPQIVIDAGNKINTINKFGTILLSCEVPETFPCEVRFGNLYEFFKIASLFDDPDFQFMQDRVIVSDESGASQEFPYPNREDLIFEQRTPPPAQPYCTFALSGQQIKTIKKALQINKVEDIQFLCQADDVGKSTGGISINVHNKARINNQFSIDITKVTGTQSDHAFNIYLEHAKDATKGGRFDILELDYQVTVIELAYASLQFFNRTMDEHGNQYTVTYLLAGKYGSQIIK